MTAPLQAGVAVVRVHGTDIPIRSEPRCRVCSSRERSGIEAGLLNGLTYQSVIDSLPDGCDLTVRNVAEHVRNDHLPVEAAAVQILRDERGECRGRQVTPAAEALADKIASGIPLARAIVAKVGQRLADDELLVTVRDGLMASEYLARYDVADDHQNLDEIGRGVRLIMETAQALMSVEVFQVFAMRLATNAYLNELMAK